MRRARAVDHNDEIAFELFVAVDRHGESAAVQVAAILEADDDGLLNVEHGDRLIEDMRVRDIDVADDGNDGHVVSVVEPDEVVAHAIFSKAETVPARRWKKRNLDIRTPHQAFQRRTLVARAVLEVPRLPTVMRSW